MTVQDPQPDRWLDLGQSVSPGTLIPRSHPVQVATAIYVAMPADSIGGAGGMGMGGMGGIGMGGGMGGGSDRHPQSGGGGGFF